MVRSGALMSENNLLNSKDISKCTAAAAKSAGVKFTFGTNNTDGNFERPLYALEMTRELGLTWKDMWMPKPDGKKPIQVRGVKK